jgi:hypothetical protein
MKLIPVVTPHGTAVKIVLSGNDVAVAIDAWLVARRVIVVGARTISVNGELCSHGEVYVDPSGYVLRKGAMIAASNSIVDGSGPTRIDSGGPIEWSRDNGDVDGVEDGAK